MAKGKKRKKREAAANANEPCHTCVSAIDSAIASTQILGMPA
jgi:hypothetical protein